ncbi:ferredoxin reductase-like protein [Fistulina hepatica ATCC 64428]|uniref:NADH-cytochrome b5 reductase n=1 Tax=Fistulina hepatica ATCC 64428 TaxID=1128425 RepID=A0A0D7A315_9AGAR|nr:ferredoxin reductase-like protein [Fistulina hepatica ATCC 64428]
MPELNLPLVGSIDTDQYVEAMRHLEIPYLGSFDLLGFLSSPAFALTMAVITTTFLYVRAVTPSTRKKGLDPLEWKEYPLVAKTVVSPNTAIYRLGLPHHETELGLPLGQHISVSAEINGKTVTRSYTPISGDETRGYVDLLIKSYAKGNVSKWFSGLKLGDKVRIKGPKGHFTYKPGVADAIGMIAGGTGITPMFQIIRAALKNPFDPTPITLVYANVGEDDILLRNELRVLVDVHPEQLTVHYVLEKPPADWQGGVGYITKEILQKYMPTNKPKNLIMLCGPPPMITAMKGHLTGLKYPPPKTISKQGDQVRRHLTLHLVNSKLFSKVFVF